MSVREQWGIECPACKSDDDLTVTFTGQATLTDEGTDDCGDHEWGDDSPISCGCGREGTVKDFKVQG